MSNAVLNQQVMRMARRAENAHPEVLRDSFVPLPSLLAQLDAQEHQVVFGRRGTGKTHLMHTVRQRREDEGALAIYLDLRTVGAAGDVAGSRPEEFSERATEVLVDLVEGIHAQIVEQVLTGRRWDDRYDRISLALDGLAAASTQIRVVGDTEVERQDEHLNGHTRSTGVELTLTRPIRASLRRETARERSRRAIERTVQRGRRVHHVLLGPLAAAIHRLAEAIRPDSLWVLVDEWSALPLELQPLVADLMRRTLFTADGVVVKIGAIHGRTRFAEPDGRGTLLGLELGADTAATLDLDDALLFRNDAASAGRFTAELLLRHLSATASSTHDVEARTAVAALGAPDDLVRGLFETRGALHTLVTAAEGVPRDALQIINLAAGLAAARAIGRGHVEDATRRFYLLDKRTTIPKPARPAYRSVLDQAIRQGGRLIPLRRDGESDDEVVQQLNDLRVLHRVHEGLSLDRDRPTELYDIYLIDFGAYLGLVLDGMIRPGDDGLDLRARFLTAREITRRAPTFVRLPYRWYRAPRPA